LKFAQVDIVEKRVTSFAQKGRARLRDRKVISGLARIGERRKARSKLNDDQCQGKK